MLAQESQRTSRKTLRNSKQASRNIWSKEDAMNQQYSTAPDNRSLLHPPSFAVLLVALPSKASSPNPGLYKHQVLLANTSLCMLKIHLNLPKQRVEESKMAGSRDWCQGRTDQEPLSCSCTVRELSNHPAILQTAHKGKCRSLGTSQPCSSLFSPQCRGCRSS